MNAMQGKSLLAIGAAIALAFAPAAFASPDHWRGNQGYRHGQQYRGHGYRDGYVYRGRADWRRSNRYRDGRGYYSRYRGHDHVGRWIAGALLAGIVTSAIVDSVQAQPYSYRRAPRVVYAPPPVPVAPRVVYAPGTVYSDAYGTQYIGPSDDAYYSEDGRGDD